MNAAAGVERLRLKFPGAPALTFRDLSFEVKRGEKVLLLGPSGCGKSTLLQVLSGLIPRAVDVPVTAERIVVPERWAFVFQDPDTQFCMPFVDEELAFVLENLLVPREEMKQRMGVLLSQVGLELEELHTPIAALSQGMKQRLAIASALALEPDVLFVDEPTALLDPEGTKQVWETIRKAGEGKTVIIVEHKIDEIVDYIDRVVLFGKSGEITADGPAADLFANYGHRLAEDGIWYPGVWDNYIRSGRYAPWTGEPAAASAGPLIRLDRFEVWRGKKQKQYVESAEVSAGEWIAVTGPNGAGKSTLLLGLMGLLQTAGGYELNGRPAEQTRGLSAEIAFVFQNPEFQFVTNSVYDEVAFSLRQEKRPEAEVEAKTSALLADFDLTQRKDNHPFQLSLGQKRRLSVASAIVKEQRILLLDEPTFGQDAKNTFALLERLEAWRRQGTAIVMVTHDPDIVSLFATRIWEVRDGRLEHDLRGPRQLAEAAESAEPAPAEALPEKESELVQRGGSR
ncbi:MAG: thiW [Paenibacillus sp.]|jgi:energy-coupling factor transport system ATP-binding protein|uniref:ABC transporter ATP-binding protein n=1 Tax=Paenibacillus sp. GCM10012303 TaxID=3317340 RepID=UPI0029F42529|nr:thiW [Paenibacillus sp.]